ncbi:MAG TPA: hypothetical protein VFD70_10580 [Anaerolineae bacterium]|nr:hypothetical protein [Anaerolineae bacterium]
MNFTETSRSIEPHSECIVFLYLRDANGIPVPNKKIKIYAGPPPTGEPPYFVDDDPNNPNRRTDATGKFQFSVSGGPPSNRLDFFCRVMGANGQPESAPIQFPFPAGETHWVIVTLAADAAPAPSPAPTPSSSPAPTPDLDLDPRLAQLVGVVVNKASVSQGQNYWKLISAKYQDPDESGGNVNIVCFVQDERGNPLPGARVTLRTSAGDTATQVTDGQGHCDHPMGAGSNFDPGRGEHGPLTVFVEGMPSDNVTGMGLPLRRHVQYILVWRRAVAQAPAPAPAPTPPETTPPETPPRTTPPPQTGNVRGRIANATAGARLVLRATGRALDALVASDGTYSFTNVPVGTYTLELAGVGAINSSLTVAANQTVTFDYPVAQPAPTKKLFKHYLLFGPGTQPGTLTNLILALDYIVHYAPIVGFSVDEAANAERVTIVGGVSAVNTQDEQRLRDGGSKVARLQAADSYALETLFQQLLASGSPYPS